MNSVLLSLLFIAFTFTSVASAASFTPKTPKQEAGGCYLISNAEELYGFASLVNYGNPEACGKLVADIVVNKTVLDKNDSVVNVDTTKYGNWTPIGSKGYKGHFDGQGHSVSGLISISSDSVGFFIVLDAGGSIRNVQVKNSYFKGGAAGAVVASSSGKR